MGCTLRVLRISMSSMPGRSSRLAFGDMVLAMVGLGDRQPMSSKGWEEGGPAMTGPLAPVPGWLHRGGGAGPRRTSMVPPRPGPSTEAKGGTLPDPYAIPRANTRLVPAGEGGPRPGMRNAAMTTDKDRKRRIRARMEKTGESYTAARSQLLRIRPRPIPQNYEELAGMGDDAVAAKTGKTWKQWVRALDDIGAMEMKHRDVAQWVHDQTGLDWWAQMVTVGYERIRGLRQRGQRLGGTFHATKSRTLPVSAAEVFHAFADEKLRRQW